MIIMPDIYTKKLFTTGALFNWGAAALIFAAGMRPDWAHLLGLDPASGSASMFFQLGVFAIALFGWAYWQVAQDPVSNRPFALLGVIGKLATVALIWIHWALGNIGWQLAALVVVDLIYTFLFWRWLMGNSASRTA